MELRLKYFWIAFIVGFALLGLAILGRCTVRRGMTRKNKPRKGQTNDVDDQASIDSESSETKDFDSSNATLPRWFRPCIETPARSSSAHNSRMINSNPSMSTSTTLATTASRQDSIIGTHGSSQRRVNQCAAVRSLAQQQQLAVTPRISPENPLHSQRGLHRGKFTFDESAAAAASVQQLGTAEAMTVTGSAEIVRSRSWEQSVRRWTSVILAWNKTEALDQSETVV